MRTDPLRLLFPATFLFALAAALTSVMLPPSESSSIQVFSAALAAQLFEISSLVADSIEGFDAVTGEPARRLFYVGSDCYEEGRAIGAAFGRALGERGRSHHRQSRLSQLLAP
jgi:hypothetical protein